MNAPEIGTYFMTGKIQVIDQNLGTTKTINLDETVVHVVAVKDFGLRWVARCDYSKPLVQMNSSGDRNWWGEWTHYQFAINDKTDISMRKVR